MLVNDSTAIAAHLGPSYLIWTDGDGRAQCSDLNYFPVRRRSVRRSRGSVDVEVRVFLINCLSTLPLFFEYAVKTDLVSIPSGPRVYETRTMLCEMRSEEEWGWCGMQTLCE